VGDGEATDAHPAHVAERTKSYEDLRVWNDAVAFSVRIYEISAGFPPAERFGLTAQVRRAGVSVPSNIAEGWGRGSGPDYVRFLRIARGSLYEVRTQLEIAHRLGWIGAEEALALDADLSSVRRQLHALIRAVDRPG